MNDFILTKEEKQRFIKECKRLDFKTVNDLLEFLEDWEFWREKPKIYTPKNPIKDPKYISHKICPDCGLFFASKLAHQALYKNIPDNTGDNLCWENERCYSKRMFIIKYDGLLNDR